MKEKIIKILDKYIREYPNTPLEKRNGTNTFDLLVQIRKEIQTICKNKK